MGKLDLDAIEARANAATPGPWTFLPDQRLERRGLGILGPSFERVALMPEPAGAHPADALFVAHARTDVPALVARVRELEAAILEACDVLDEKMWRGTGHIDRDLEEAHSKLYDLVTPPRPK